MAFGDLKENRMIIRRMQDAVSNNSVFHAYILEGQDEQEKLLLARNFVKAILCEAGIGDACETCLSCRKINHDNHEDVIWIAPEGSSIKDEVVAELQGRLRKKPYAGERTIAIIEKADTMTPKAQNRLLKTLEEPLGRNVILLLTQNAGNLALTINSRCILYRLPMISSREMTQAVDDQYHLIAFARGLAERKPLYLLSKDLKEIGLKRESAMSALEILESWFRDLLLLSCDAAPVAITNKAYIDILSIESRLYQRSMLVSIIEAIEHAKDDINKNINVSYALKSMVLMIQEEKDGKGSRNQI